MADKVLAPQQAIIVDFTARITDEAGNDILWDAGPTTQIIVDEVMPLDPAFGLPEAGYNYTLESAFDNYVELLAH